VSRRINQLMAERSAGRVVGREAELEQLSGLLHDDGPVVAFVHGIAGIGKTTLLRTFAGRARSDGAIVIEIDGTSIEPSAGGLRQALAAAIGLEPSATDVVIEERIAGFGSPVVIVIDAYEHLRLLDTWLRQQFVLHLPVVCRVLIAGRERPLLAWAATFGMSGALLDLSLEGLADADALTMLRQCGLDDTDAQTIVRLTRGHPWPSNSRRRRRPLRLERLRFG
jgi:hypothetical protein